MGDSMTTLTANDVMAARLELAKRGVVPFEALGIPPKLIPVFDGPARYRISFGGRGSGKTRTFALMSAVRGDIFATNGVSGVILCAREFQNSLEDSSFAEVKAAILSDDYLSTRWEIGATYIRHVTRKVEYVFRGLRHNRESLKGLARILIAWPDEAEQITEESWQTLIPTVREEGSEIWVSYNPASDKSATHKRFRLNATPDMKWAEMNWQDNPYFPSVLEEERRRDMEARPDDYGHIWEGQFKTAFQGSYYAAHLTQAEVARPKRITSLTADPLMTIRAYWDIGGTGQKADATAIWIVQFVGQNIYVLDHYEAVGQPLATHVAWLRKNGYEDALCILPHDGVNHEKIYKVTYESALREAGFAVRVIPNQGTGAAMLRVEAARRLFPRIWFNEETTLSGRTALRAYREKWDENRNVGLGPLHDWASNSADAFGLMCIDWEEPRVQKKKSSGRPGGSGSWMG